MQGGRGGKRQAELEMYKDMDGRSMGSMPGGMMHGGGQHAGDVAAFYGYPSHMDSMMSSGYVPYLLSLSLSLSLSHYIYMYIHAYIAT
jgi:hypothetical protein